MVGREAYHHPWTMAGWDRDFLDAQTALPEREAVEERMLGYMDERAAAGVHWSHVARHMMGLWNGTPGARRWRQVWSDHRLKNEAPHAVARLATAARAAAVPAA